MATYEDFTTFTEVDVAADRIQKTTNHIDHLSYRNEITYLYKDYGAVHFGDFEHRIKVREVSSDDDSSQFSWGLWNDIGDFRPLQNGNKTGICIKVDRDGSNYRLRILEAYNGRSI